MTTLRERLDEYLQLRRSLGFELNDLERQVGLFCTWLQARGQTTTFTIDDAVTWARLNPDAHPSWWATRLSLVRRFAGYLNANDVDVPVIPSGLLPARKPRAVPFIYSQHDINALLAACDTEFTDERIAATLRTVIGLLAATGLRIGEALNLRVPDIDQHDDLLMITAAKSHERLVPVHPSTTAALLQYIALPARMATRPDPHGPVFVTCKGTGYVYVSFQSLFKRVREAAGLAPRGRARPDCTTSDIRRTAGLCALLVCFRWWGPCGWCFRPHNPGGLVSVPACRASRSGGTGWLAALLGVGRIGEESLLCSFRYRMQR
jgi:integrase